MIPGKVAFLRYAAPAALIRGHPRLNDFSRAGAKPASSAFLSPHFFAEQKILRTLVLETRRWRRGVITEWCFSAICCASSIDPWSSAKPASSAFPSPHFFAEQKILQTLVLETR